MTTPTKPNNRIGPYVGKTFKDESFRAYVPRPLPPDPPLVLQPLLPALEQANCPCERTGFDHSGGKLEDCEDGAEPRGRAFFGHLIQDPTVFVQDGQGNRKE